MVVPWPPFAAKAMLTWTGINLIRAAVGIRARVKTVRPTNANQVTETVPPVVVVPCLLFAVRITLALRQSVAIQWLSAAMLCLCRYIQTVGTRARAKTARPTNANPNTGTVLRAATVRNLPFVARRAQRPDLS